MSGSFFVVAVKLVKLLTITFCSQFFFMYILFNIKILMTVLLVYKYILLIDMILMASSDIPLKCFEKALYVQTSSNFWYVLKSFQLKCFIPNVMFSKFQCD